MTTPHEKRSEELDPWLGGEPGATPTRVEPEATERPPAPPPISGTPEAPAETAEPTVAEDTWRLFVGIDLNDAARDEIASFVMRMPPYVKPMVRWIAPDSMHLTLAFLGDVDIDRVDDIRRILKDAASRSGPFTMRLDKTGAFPNNHEPKILWIGFEGEVRRLAQLHGRVTGALSTLGFEPERRAFTPHVTVGRVNRDVKGRDAGDVGHGWRRMMPPKERAVIPVTTVTLFRSHLGPDGAVYERLFEAPLG